LALVNNQDEDRPGIHHRWCGAILSLHITWTVGGCGEQVMRRTTGRVLRFIDVTVEAFKRAKTIQMQISPFVFCRYFIV
jgi:hypothetical protein